jgi:hypothetical protein
MLRGKLFHIPDKKDLALASAALVLLAVAIGSVQDHDGPRPDRAFMVILGYFVSIAVAGCTYLLVGLFRRSPGAGPAAGTPPPPPQLSPTGLPIDPRKPAPLVAHAVAQHGSRHLSRCPKSLKSNGSSRRREQNRCHWDVNLYVIP